MTEKNRLTWFQILGRTLAILLVGVVTGCRLGERRIESPRGEAPADGFSGYYLTKPKSLTYFVTTRDTHQGSVAVSKIPAAISKFIPNPVELVMIDLTTGKGALTSPQGQSGLPIYLSSDLALSYKTVTSDKTFWDDPACQTHVELSESGKLIQDPTLKGPADSPLPISGSLQLKVDVVTQFYGNCVPSFESIAKCYKQAKDCGGNTEAENKQYQMAVWNTFRPIVDSKIISEQDIPDIVNYAYQVVYE